MSDKESIAQYYLVYMTCGFNVTRKLRGLMLENYPPPPSFDDLSLSFPRNTTGAACRLHFRLPSSPTQNTHSEQQCLQHQNSPFVTTRGLAHSSALGYNHNGLLTFRRQASTQTRVDRGPRLVPCVAYHCNTISASKRHRRLGCTYNHKKKQGNFQYLWDRREPPERSECLYLSVLYEPP